MKATHLTFILFALILLFAHSTVHLAQAPSATQSAIESSRALTQDETLARLRSSNSQRASVEVTFGECVPASTLRNHIPQTTLRVFRVFYEWGNHRGGYNTSKGQTLKESLTDFEGRHLQFLQRHIRNLSVDSNDMLLQRGVSASTISEMEHARQELL